MDGSDVIVETNLAEEVEYRGKSFVRHARTRFVERKPLPSIEAPKLGDPWCPLTVRARLQRIVWVLKNDPRVQPQQVRSHMPEPVREMWKDLPAEPMRMVVASVHQDAVNRTLAALMRHRFDDEAKAIIYAIGERSSGDKLGQVLGCSDTWARLRMKRMLDQLAEEWNGEAWRPDAFDVERAARLIHRNRF